jgi:hypothetical protein
MSKFRTTQLEAVKRDNPCNVVAERWVKLRRRGGNGFNQLRRDVPSIRSRNT